MADISKITLPDENTYDIKDTTARSGLATKQDTLVSGTNIKTINNESLLGSGNITIQGGGDSLPDQTGHSGDILTTNGTAASWMDVSEASSVSIDTSISSSSTDNTIPSSKAVYDALSNVDALPAQSSSTDGKVLTSVYDSSTSTATATWESLPADSDENVKQTASTPSSYTYWRPLLVGSSSNSSEGFSPSTATAGSYTFNTLEVQPSSGSIRMGTASMYNGSYTSKISPTTLTANRTITIPNASGTMALTSDIPTVPSPADTTPLMDNATAAVGTSTDYAREDHVHPTDTSRAASSHTHGDITNDGDITASAPTITTGDQLIINDESASKITNSGITFDTNVTTTYLRRDGTWAVPSEEIFICIYDTSDPTAQSTSTSFDDATAAFEAGKTLVAKRGILCGNLVRIQGSFMVFSCVANRSNVKYWTLNDTGWEETSSGYIEPPSSPSNGDVLTYDSTNGWVASAPSGGLPDQTGNSGKYLTTNGTAASWGAASATSTKSIDSSPTSASSNLVTSGGVYTAINNKVNRTTAVNAADTNYTTLMARGVVMLDGTTYDAVSDWSTYLVNGAIAWRYE